MGDVMKNTTVLRQFSNLAGVLTAAGLWLVLQSPVWAQADSGRVFYRYQDAAGVTVINHQIPPEYAQKGYEVVTARGDVLRVVAPAPSGQEATEQEQQRQRQLELDAWDAELRRRYSTVRDIEAAKQRKLAQVNGSIAILQGNLRNLKQQIAHQHAQAAKNERLGVAVPQALLSSLASLEEELHVNEENMAERKQQYQRIEAKYNRDIERFKVIEPAPASATSSPLP